MTALDVLIELRATGIRVSSLPNGNLYVSPRSRLTPAILTCLRQKKADILALLDGLPEGILPDSSDPLPSPEPNTDSTISSIESLNVERHEADRALDRGYDITGPALVNCAGCWRLIYERELVRSHPPLRRTINHRDFWWCRECLNKEPGYGHTGGRESAEGFLGRAPVFENVSAEIDASIVNEIRRIEPIALALGWPPQRLWNADFWAAGRRGLASIMDPGDRLIKVEPDLIVIEKDDARRTRQCFPRFH